MDAFLDTQSHRTSSNIKADTVKNKIQMQYKINNPVVIRGSELI